MGRSASPQTTLSRGQPQIEPPPYRVRTGVGTSAISSLVVDRSLRLSDVLQRVMQLPLRACITQVRFHRHLDIELASLEAHL